MISFSIMCLFSMMMKVFVCLSGRFFCVFGFDSIFCPVCDSHTHLFLFYDFLRFSHDALITLPIIFFVFSIRLSLKTILTYSSLEVYCLIRETKQTNIKRN